MSGDPRLVFREATDADLPVIAEIISAAFGPVAERLGLNRQNAPRFAAFETAESLREHLDKWGIRMLLLLVGGRVVGCGGWSPDAQGAPRGWLARIAVRPEHQGRGYGSALVRRLEDELRQHGFSRARLAHADLHRFYGRLGYQTVETRQLEDWHTTLTFQEKDL